MPTVTNTKRAARSGNPATAAAAKQEAAAKKRAEVEAEAAARAAREEQIRAAQAKFENLVLPEPELDEDGYEIIPDQSALAGGSFKFKLGGEAFILPNLQYIPIALAMKLNQGTEQDAQRIIFDRYAPGIFDHANADQLMHIIKRWRDHSAGVGLGE